MRLVERMFDNAWYVASRETPSHEALQAELERALQAHRDASRDLERARAVSPSAVALALSTLNSTQAALGRAEAKAAAATRCTHVVDGHAFTVRDQTGVTGLPRPRSAPARSTEPRCSFLRGTSPPCGPPG